MHIITRELDALDFYYTRWEITNNQKLKGFKEANAKDPIKYETLPEWY